MKQLIAKATLAPYQDYYEPQYLLRLYELYCSVDKAAAKEDRTGVGRYSKFGGYLRHNTGVYGPALLHTKQVHMKSVVAELCWFLRGDTNVRWLQEQGCRIWDSWALPSGELGLIYGHQWREAGVYDQIAKTIKTIIDKPSDSGNLVCAWNVNDIHEMALRPCHTLWQVCVENGVLDLMLYQRSADWVLGVPFNAASYTILQCLLAKMTGTRPGVFHHYFGDTHVYANQLEAAKEHLDRFSEGLTTHSYEVKFKGIPKYRKGDEVKESVLRDIIPECIEIMNYKPMSAIKAPVAV